MTTTTTNKALTTGTKEKIKSLLGKGLSPAVVATATGVSDSYISQLISDPHFAAEVAELRTAALQAHSDRDATYDSIEDSLLEKLKDCIDYMVKPGEILGAIKVINGAQRRGTNLTNSTNGALTNQTVINLVMPNHVISSFATNANGQVVEAQHHIETTKEETTTKEHGSNTVSAPNNLPNKQSLVTLPSNNVKELLANTRK